MKNDTVGGYFSETFVKKSDGPNFPNKILARFVSFYSNSYFAAITGLTFPLEVHWKTWNFYRSFGMRNNSLCSWPQSVDGKYVPLCANSTDSARCLKTCSTLTTGLFLLKKLCLWKYALTERSSKKTSYFNLSIGILAARNSKNVLVLFFFLHLQTQITPWLQASFCPLKCSTKCINLFWS